MSHASSDHNGVMATGSHPQEDDELAVSTLVSKQGMSRPTEAAAYAARLGERREHEGRG